MLQSHIRKDVDAACANYELARRLTLGILALLICTFSLLPSLVANPITEPLTFFFGVTQDIPLAWLFLILALLRPAQVGASTTRDVKTTVSAPLLCAAATFLVAWLGARFIFHGYLLSRDEQMAVFDQEIFAHGRLMWPISPEWRPFADALNRLFMLPIGENEFWVSAYLPVHAAFRALLGTIGIADLASPLMAALSTVSLWVIARKLWPDSSRTVLLALLLIATSSQLLITSMTAYAMTMHLALNLVWLALFLSDRPQTHVGAALVGFLATGIHEPLFHPLFALPFFLLLFEQRRLKTLAFYLTVYAAIGLFWVNWPHWMASHATVVQDANCGSSHCAGSVGYFDRLLGVITAIDLKHVWLTAANMLRFICWQHPLLTPLALFGAISSWKSDPLVRAFSIGFALPVIVMAIILPYQGHGWGYRYLEPVLGNAIILACYGFHQLERSGLSLRRPVIITTAAALLLIPVHAVMAARFARPFARVHNDILATPADVVIVDTELVPFGVDLVLNRPDLSNRPKLMIASRLKAEDVLRLCKRYSISFYDPQGLSPIAELFRSVPPARPSSEALKEQQFASAAKCRLIDSGHRTSVTSS